MQKQQKKVAADSSSIILLLKASLLQRFLESYRVGIAGAVYTELTIRHKLGSAELAQRLGALVTSDTSIQLFEGMGRGECATINLYYQQACDFILLDDKRAAKYCKAKGIPFVNSLLVSRLLYLYGCINSNEQRSAKRLLIREGYYSNAIIDRAETISEERLMAFLPA